MKKYKKLLIISHNCLSKTGSNGRTLLNYLSGWPKEKIAQLYLHAEQPDFDACEEYFCITDSSVLKSILKRKPAGYIVKDAIIDGTEKQNGTSLKSISKNSFIYLAREFAWRSRFWNRNNLDTWVESVQPEVILVQAGDAGFLFEIALNISQRFLAPIVVYNTEGYYFKKESYLLENKFSQLFFRSLNRVFKKSYEKLVKAAKVQIYNCDLLCNDYEKVFQGKKYVIMNTSEFTQEDISGTKKEQIIYAGNLGLLRHRSLIEFANALQKISPKMFIDVYGKAPDEKVQVEMENCVGIHLHGFIPYEELKKKLRESKYLLHIESFDPFYKEDLKYAFSTKIADSLAAGACLFVYAPDNMAVIQYLKGKEAAVLITDRADLESEISRVFANTEVSKTYAYNGRMLAEKNHNIRINREVFQKVLLE